MAPYGPRLAGGSARYQHATVDPHAAIAADLGRLNARPQATVTSLRPAAEDG